MANRNPQDDLLDVEALFAAPVGAALWRIRFEHTRISLRRFGRRLKHTVRAAHRAWGRDENAESVTYNGYHGPEIHIPDIHAARGKYVPGSILMSRQVAFGLPLWANGIIYPDGRAAIRNYFWDRRENTYWHTVHNLQYDGAPTEAQRRTIWRLWAGLDRLDPIESGGVGATLQSLAQHGVEYPMAEVEARYLNGKKVYLA